MIKEYLAYIRDNPEGYWFKAKLYGWGWVPARPQGWLVLFVFILLMALNAYRLDANEHMTSMLFPFIARTFALVILLILVCYTTGEKPRWRWGPPKK